MSLITDEMVAVAQRGYNECNAWIELPMEAALKAIEPMIEKLIEDACDVAITNDRWEMDGRQ